ncbi:VTT domain-containing protein [Lactobacillus selangorensis]|nr:VTT domain-containing protein [Lactobacillus selangorensis]
MFNLTQLLPNLIVQYGSFVYLGLFAAVFIETGIVVFPFLPGDSLLFLSGSIAAMSGHSLNLAVLLLLLSIAAIAGDSLNFEIGKRFGQRLSHSKWIKPQYLQDAQVFFQRHGNSAIFLGRFMPIIRTFIPFTAGISKMKYEHFILFNVLGGITWVAVATLSGYFFGNIPVIKSNFELIMIAIIVISLLPAVLVALQKKMKGPKADAEK